MAMAGKKVSDRLRAAILAAPVSRYRIAADVGINASILSRFVNHKAGLDIQNVDKLAAYLGMDLVKLKKQER